MTEPDTKNAQERLGNTHDNISWLRECVALATDRPCVVEYLPPVRKSPLDFGFGFGGNEQREAMYRVTIRGIVPQPHIDVARVALRDEAYVRQRLELVLKDATA